MRNQSFNILSAADSASQTGSAVDCAQIVSASFHVFFGDAAANGTLKIQASNDSPPLSYQQPAFVPTNWIDIPSATATITSGAAALITIANLPYRWVRAVYTRSSGGSTTIKVNMCGLGV